MHEDGKHKARVFAAVLGLHRRDAEWLRARLLQAAISEPATKVAESRFGTLYMIDFRDNCFSTVCSLLRQWFGSSDIAKTSHGSRHAM